MIPVNERAARHLRAGRLLLCGIPEKDREGCLFMIVDQFTKGIGLITSAEEKMTVARLNHRAGLKARQSTAYDLAYQSLRAAVDLLGEGSWKRCYEFALAVYTDAAEAAYLSGDHNEMQRLGTAILQNALNVLDKVHFIS